MNGLTPSVSSRTELLADIPLVDREDEAFRLHDAILRREGLMISGPAGIGKTALLRKTPVFLLARGPTERDVGHVGNVYWRSRQQLSLGPLPAQKGRELLECCIRKLGLEKLDLADFREQVLRLSGLVPGTIVRMCHLAQAPEYRFGSRLKTKLIHIDCLMSGAQL